MDILYEYDGSFGGLLCCVYDCYTRREWPAEISVFGEAQTTLFEKHAVVTDGARAKRIYASIVSRSQSAAALVRRSYFTCLESKELRILEFIRELYRVGGSLMNRYSNDFVYPLVTAVRHMRNETELLRGFVRFSDFGGVLVSEIEPKNRVLWSLRFHFQSRFADDTFMIYDKTHRELLMCSPGKWSIVPVDDFEMSAPDKKEAAFRRLWKTFYDTIAIKERDNPRRRMTHMPKRYWGAMTEFQDEKYFIPAEEEGGARLSPASQDGIPEPGKRGGP
jgi:probable DNA metabolism protein